MKKFFYFISLSALLVLLNYPVSLAQEISRPKMVLEEETFDAGEVREGGIIAHEFRVLNAGDSPLEIKNVRTA
jgi:hypothetical protein